MKEAFGQTMMLEIMMIFIVLIVSFTAIIATVAKTFRVKNGIINIIEQYYYATDPLSSSLTEVDNYLNNVSYLVDVDEDYQTKCNADGKYFDKGYCVKQMSTTSPYYKVTVYVQFELPIFWIRVVLPISGETKSVTSLSS